MMMTNSHFLNDGSIAAPRLAVYLNLGTLYDLRSDSVWFSNAGVTVEQRLLADGFEGIQLTSDEAYSAKTLLPYCGLDRINLPSEAAAIVQRHVERGDLCLTLHLGWGLEDDEEVDRLVEATLNASVRHKLPVFIETHRATITQDLWRTVQIAKRFPEVRFNGDFSHYYCGQELVYGEWKTKLGFMQPIFDRVGFLHGRIASPGCMQVPIDADLSAKPSQAHGEIDYLVHFKELWTSAMKGFLASASAGDILIFAPELLSGNNYYARLFPDASGTNVEESDRYAQALLYAELARSCFTEAQRAASRSALA
jgi:hypothetical protein